MTGSPSVVWTVMFGAALLGAAAALVGSFAVLRRRSLIGDMLSHAALPGICATFLLFHTRQMLTLSLGALATGLLGVICVSAIVRWTRTSEDAAIGTVLSTFFGAGVVLLTVVQRDTSGSQAGLNTYLFGEISSLQARDLGVITATALFSLVAVLLVYKELKLVSFDHDFATAQGWPTGWLDMGIMAAVAVVTIIGLPICGVVLMAAMLITPAAAARYWSNRLGTMLLIAAIVGAAAAIGGCLLAAPKVLFALQLGWLPGVATQNLPPGPLIVLTGAALLMLSMLFAPEQGIVARSWKHWRLRTQIINDHLLRALFELGESSAKQRPWIDRARLAKYGHGRTSVLRWGVWQAQRSGQIEQDRQRIRLTPQGFQNAVALIRAHRLWELYLLEDLQYDFDQMHAGADAIEHLLPQQVVERLEASLHAEGRLPEYVDGEVPASPHPLESP